MLIFLVVDEVLPEEGTLMEKLVQLPEENITSKDQDQLISKDMMIQGVF